MCFFKELQFFLEKKNNIIKMLVMYTIKTFVKLSFHFVWDSEE